MYVMTYTSLLEDLRRYLERGFTNDPQVYEQLPRIITLAERRVARDLKVEGFIRAVTTTLIIGETTYAKPDRWRDTISMRLVETGGYLQARSYEYIRNYWSDPTETGTPEYYADYDYQHWLISPTPSAALTLEVVYYEQPQFLGDDTSTNWLTQYAPDVLLYAALLECMPYLKNDARIATWQQMYERAAGSLSSEDMKRISDRTASRTEP